MGCVSAVRAAGIRRPQGPVGLEAAHPQDWKVGAAGSSAHGPCTGLLRYLLIVWRLASSGVASIKDQSSEDSRHISHKDLS